VRVRRLGGRLLLGFLVAWWSAAHARTHAGPHGLHVLQHPIHVADQRFHISTLFRQRAISFVSLIVKRLAFIWAREAFIFSTSAFDGLHLLLVHLLYLLAALAACLRFAHGALDEAGACDCVSCAHASEAKVKSRASGRILCFIGLSFPRIHTMSIDPEAVA
jgi:hypothetical protein